VGLFDGTALERAVICESCGQDVKSCDCPPSEPNVEIPPDIPPEKQKLSIRIEKRKRGKQVTVISGFRGHPEQLKNTMTALKNELGTGGTLDESKIELQGSLVDRASAACRRLGYQVK